MLYPIELGVLSVYTSDCANIDETTQPDHWRSFCDCGQRLAPVWVGSPHTVFPLLPTNAIERHVMKCDQSNTPPASSAIFDLFRLDHLRKIRFADNSAQASIPGSDPHDPRIDLEDNRIRHLIIACGYDDRLRP